MTDPTDPPDTDPPDLEQFLDHMEHAFDRFAFVAARLGYRDLNFEPIDDAKGRGVALRATTPDGESMLVAVGWVEVDGGSWRFKSKVRPDLARELLKIADDRRTRPLDLGWHVYVTPAARVIGDGYLHACLERHRLGDSGVTDGDDHDRAVNHAARVSGGRVLSAYPIDPTRPCPGHGPNALWIITEGTGPDRITTILLASEY